MKTPTFIAAFILPALIAISLPARAQLLPITTTSTEARQHFLKGRDAAHHYQFAEAREHLDRAIAADSFFVLAHLHRGGSARFRAELLDYIGRAEANRDRVTKGEQQLIDAFRAFLVDRDFNRAIEILHPLSDEYPDDPYLPAYLGFRYYRNMQRYEEGSEQFRLALLRDSNFVQAYNWLGYIAMDKDDYAAAEKYFQSYIQSASDQPRAYNSLGVLRLRQGRYEEAIQLFSQSYAVDPRFTESRDNYVRAHIEQVKNQLEQALISQDVTAIVGLFTVSGQLFPFGSEPVGGIEAIGRYWQGVFDKGLSWTDLETVEIFTGADGETATEVGRFNLVDREQTADTRSYVFIWAQTPEGWKLHRAIWTTDRDPGE